MSARNWILLLAVLCLALGMADFAYDKHGYFEFESLIGFHGLFAMLIGAAAAFVVFLTHKLLTRGADYYAPRSVDAESHPAADLEREHTDA